jgi:hypothetical protein
LQQNTTTATGMQQKASPKKADKVGRVSRFRDNISEDITQTGSEEQEEEIFVPEAFWKDVQGQFKNSQSMVATKLKDKMSRFFEERKISEANILALHKHLKTLKNSADA